MRERLLSVERQTGIKPKELEDLIELPESLFHIWTSFIQLHNKRTSTGYGINPIQFSEILAYCTLMQIQFHDWEINLLQKLDGVVLELNAKEIEKQQAKQKAKSK